MGLEFINQVIKATIILAAICFLPVSLYFSFYDSLGLVAGAAWGCINLLFIKHLVQNVIGLEEKNFLKIFLILGIKFPLLYFLGYCLLSTDLLPVLYVILGSTLIFPVIFLQSLKGLLGKAAIVLTIFTTFTTSSLHASLAGVPEVPNIFTFIHKIFHDTPWSEFIHDWEYIIFSIIISTVICIIFTLAARRNELIPTGLQNAVEGFVEVLRNFVIDILGPEGEKYVPLLGTLFIYILTMNWMAVVPLMKPPTASINITAGLAICVFVLVQYLNFRNWGVLGYLYHLAGSPNGALGWALVPLMFPIEVLTQLTRPITLALRLFGNIVGEDILIGAAALFGVYLLSSFPVIGGIPMQIPFLFLALLTGLMQALVFTLLTTIYILLSMPSSEHDSSAVHFS